MPNCKCCGKPVVNGVVLHSECYERLRPVGKWIPVVTELGYECSNCRKRLDDYINASEWAGLSEIPNYCPNCGAKMEEVN